MTVIPERISRGSGIILLVQSTTDIDCATRNERTGFPPRARGNGVVVASCYDVPRLIEKLQMVVLRQQKQE